MRKHVEVKRSAKEQQARKERRQQADNQRKRKPAADEQLEEFKKWYEDNGDVLTLRQLQKTRMLPPHFEQMAADDAKKTKMKHFVDYQRNKKKK